jgi:hypothetical protein
VTATVILGYVDLLCDNHNYVGMTVPEAGQRRNVLVSPTTNEYVTIAIDCNMD